MTDKQMQEPVAIVSGYYGGQCVILPTDPARLLNSGTALYTAPPAAQPALKPLTHERIAEIGDEVANMKLVGVVPDFRERFARAIEADHGIKGDA